MTQARSNGDPNRSVDGRRRRGGAVAARVWTRASGRAVGTDRGRSGAAAVEFALILPVLLTLVMGIVEFAWLFFVENEMAYVARSVTRDVSVGAINTVDAEPEVQTRLNHFGYTFTVLVTEAANDVTIDVSVPMADAALINFLGLFGSGTIDASVTMRKEP